MFLLEAGQEAFGPADFCVMEMTMQPKMQIEKSDLGSRRSHTIPRRYIEPILYLADRMARMGSDDPAPRRVVDELAKAAGEPTFRQGPDFRAMNDQKACDAIDLSSAQTGALVVLALVLKAHPDRPEAGKEFFGKVRTMMGCEPVKVPAEFEAHKRLAIDYVEP